VRCGGGFCGWRRCRTNGDQARGAGEADGILRAGVIVGATIPISMTTIAALTKRGPVSGNALHESGADNGAGGVIRALQTSGRYVETTRKLAEKLEKKPVAVNDAPGFVSTRADAVIHEAAYA